MNIIELTPKNSYSCQFCQKDFDFEETIIIQGMFPVCSFKCKFNIIYGILKRGYSEENLEFMHKTLKKNPEKYEFNKNIALFDLSKYFSKYPLSSVISLFSFLILNSHYSKHLSITHFSSFPPPIEYRGMRKELRTFLGSLHSTEFENIRDNLEDLKKWF